MTSHFAAGPQTPSTSVDPSCDNHARIDKPRRIMIVEDQMMVAWAMESIIEDLGHAVIGIHSNGPAAIEAVAQQAPDLLLMDINLGDDMMDGIEAARHIRMISQAPILFISAYNDAQTRARIAEIVPGAGLLAKPVQIPLLRLAIDPLTTVPH